ncbi:serine/threonine-protein kinase [Dokdonella sp.]|uniref:serine/threonine-protein kinase n=1 Tax=Dokdonella sp. TaxID=2291710 RepID=UPI001B142CEB|nr:serine/threonine-protein kinase [Dokdonella sp.]MBO9664218.1 protein kinase [Dokdonella sp.]
MSRDIVSLLREALDQPEGIREAWIDTTCRDAPRLAAELRELLRRDAQDKGILDRPLGTLAKGLQFQIDDRAQELIGRHVGPYRITALLGTGGMGVVYLAQRTDVSPEQTVALKLVRSEKLRGDAQARFARERRILARLSHPHIAHLIDGGFDEHGHPWLAMEYVDGELLMHWCNARKLGVPERLRLLLDLCEAVEYAHRHSVIHRDIKPSNVLVDRDGTAKLFDFGIAKLLDEDDPDAPATETRARLLTPVYAAPEQIRGDKVTTATDVHALGLLLYELLCGRRPYGGDDVSQFDLLREILERDAPAMSARLAAPGSPAARDVAAERGLGEPALQRVLRGDLHHIVAKALRKEPEARYRTVAEFGDDLRRHLEDRPVLAVEGARIYRVRKFVAQHRLAVGFAALALLCLLTALVGMGWLGHRLRQQAARADEQSRLAVATRDFLLDLFKSASPERTLGTIPDAVQLVDIGMQRAESQLKAQPDLQAQVLGTLGNIYLNLGKYDTALATLDKARGIAATTLGDTAAATMQLDLDTANAIYAKQANSDRVRPLLDRVITVQRQLPTAQRTLLVPALIVRGSLERQIGGYDRAEALLREAIDLARAEGETGQRQLADALSALSLVFAQTGKGADAIPLLREGMAIASRILPVEDPARINYQSQLGAGLSAVGQFAEAEALLRGVAESHKRVLGEQHPEYIESLITLSKVLLAERKLDELEALVGKALELGLRYDEKSDLVANSSQILAVRKILQGDAAAAAPYAQRAHAIFAARYGKDSYLALDAETTLIDVQLRTGEYAQAEAAARSFLARVEPLKIAPMLTGMQYKLGQILRMRGQPAEARRYQEQALMGWTASFGERSPTSLLARIELAKAERDAGDRVRAREVAHTAAGFAPAVMPAGDGRVLQARAVIAQLDYLEGRCADSALADLEALRKQLERDAPKAGGEIAGAALMASLCRQQSQGRTRTDAESDVAIRTRAQQVLRAAVVDPFYRTIAKQELRKQ